MINKITPKCPYFYQCSGCQYQDISYEDEIKIKQDYIEKLFESFNLSEGVLESILVSPQEYHYRHRIDLKYVRTKDNRDMLGFQPKFNPVLEIKECPIARREISDYLPQLKKEVLAKRPDKYRLANITIRSCDDNKVRWGGMGKGSLELPEDQYMYTQINDKIVYFSMDTFFQSNLFILPSVMNLIRSIPIWQKDAFFYDLYGGVGLFGLSVVDQVNQVRLIESSLSSVILARYNVRKNGLKNFSIHSGDVEDELPKFMHEDKGKKIVMVDPPRVGLSKDSIDLLNALEGVDDLLYLSCNPKTLADNLRSLIKNKWVIKKVYPLDFFPRTTHLETLVWLHKNT